MQQITSTAGLKEAIRQLEIKRDFEGLQLRHHAQSAIKSLNPFNIIRGNLDKAASTPLLLNNIVVTFLGLASGYLTKKIIIGRSGSKLRVLMGSVIQYGVLNLITQQTDAIRAIGHYLIQLVSRKKEQYSN